MTSLIDTIFYCIFADGSPQAWNEPRIESKEKGEEKKPKRDRFLVSLILFYIREALKTSRKWLTVAIWLSWNVIDDFHG